MNKEAPWEKERRRLIKLVREKKVGLDDRYIIVSDGKVAQILRMDLLPYHTWSVECELDSL